MFVYLYPPSTGLVVLLVPLVFVVIGTTNNLGLEEYLARDIPNKERRILRDNKRRLAYKYRIL